MLPWALVTPSNRGIGLEIVRHLLKTTSLPIVATARKDLDQTKEQIFNGLADVKEDRVKVLKIDVLGQWAVRLGWVTSLLTLTRRVEHLGRSIEMRRPLSQERVLPSFVIRGARASLP